jgi:hypothetical protein
MTTSSADVSGWVAAYWPELEVTMDAISTIVGSVDLFAELVTETATSILSYDITNKSSSEVLRARALMVCVEAAGMPGIAGWEEQRHYNTLKIMDRTWKKEEGLDHFIGELQRILPAYTKTDSVKLNTILGTKAVVDSLYNHTRLDQRKTPYTERDISVIRDLWNTDEDNEGADY